MRKVHKEMPELVRVGKLRERTLEICRCKKLVCIILELKEYEILERA